MRSNEKSDSGSRPAAAPKEREPKLMAQAALWVERASIADRQGQEDLQFACKALSSLCELYAGSPAEKTPEFVKDANKIRKKIEASERHRTMCVEHGLSDAAIDATYEIQGLEKELLALLLNLKASEV